MLLDAIFTFSGSGASACASWLQTEKSAWAKYLEEQKRQVEEAARVKRLRTVREDRKHFSNFSCRSSALLRWRYNCKSNQPELRQLSKREAR